MSTSQPLDHIGQYVLLKKLGRGAMATVFLARSQVNGEEVALKLFNDELRTSSRPRELFLREIEVMMALSHPHVVRLLDRIWTGESFLLTMEYCNQGNVETLVKQNCGRVPLRQAVEIIVQVLDGLEYAHTAELHSVKMARGGFAPARGVVHRDIKPSNILLCGESEAEEIVAKIGDFGLAKAYELAGLTGQTRTGMTGGTPMFAPRQQAINFRRIGPEVDVWATAATLYFMLTGRPPRDFPPSMTGWQVVTETSPVPIRQRVTEVPDSLAEVIDDALDDSAKELHFKSAAKFRSALLEATGIHG